MTPILLEKKMSLLKRPMIADGVLYYNDPKALDHFVKSSISAYNDQKNGRPFALITPDANYLLGNYAYGASYAQLLNEEYDTAIILSPLHKKMFYALGLTTSDAFETPFGDILVDQESNDILRHYSEDFFIDGEQYHMAEHSVEVQLPYLIAALGHGIKILPIIIGEPNTKFTILLAKALKYLFEKSDKRFLVIAVTNLSSELNYNSAVAMDSHFIEILKKNEPDLLAEQLALNQIKADGSGSVVTLSRLNTLMDAKEFSILKYYTSGEITEEKTKVEGYLSAALYY